MSAPTVAFDKPSYHQGDLVTATVTYSAPVASVTFAASGAMVGSATGSFALLPSWAASDGTPRVWTLKSDNGTQAVFTATA